MIWHLFLTAVLVFSPSNTYQRMQQPVETRLDKLRDIYRPLLVFAASEKDAKFIEQMYLISEGASALRERQVMFVPLLAGIDSGSWAQSIDSRLVSRLFADDAAAARHRYHVSPVEFTVVLIGKDGGEKFRTHSPVTIKRLNTVIDAMPMRQQEIRDGHTN